MHELKYNKNDIIFKNNDAANSLYIVTLGEIEIEVPTKTNLLLRKG
jgi:hypothetical protein